GNAVFHSPDTLFSSATHTPDASPTTHFLPDLTAPAVQLTGPQASPIPDAGSAQQSSSLPSGVDLLGQMPLRFEENHGQVDGPSRYLARGEGYSLFLAPSGATLDLSGPVGGQGSAADSVVTMHLVGANE